MRIIPRHVEGKFLQKVEQFRCIAVLGARQVGKSHFLKHIVSRHGGTYLTLDDPMVRDELRVDPIAWIERHRTSRRIFVIDEAIKVPEVFSAVKVIVDREDPHPTRIVLTSSSNYLMIRKIKESLAGRIGLIPLYTLSWSEVLGSGPSRLNILFSDLERELQKHKDKSLGSPKLNRERTAFLLNGGFPEIRCKDNWEFTRDWAFQYFSTYVLPLAVELFEISKQSAFEHVFRQLGLRSSTLLNYSDIAKTAEASSVTVKNYTHHLEAMMLCKLLPQFFYNPLKRLVKMPKVHLLDPLFVTWNFGVPKDLGLIERAGMDGALYESWIYSELLKANTYESHFFDYLTWHTQDDSEVDLIISSGQEHIPVEIKYKTKLARRDLSGLKSWLAGQNQNTPLALLVYPGTSIQQLDNKIWAIPDHFLLGLS